ncbi:MAG: DUF881 domain-containing protein [Desulfitobacteriaceae bacterium]|nr:DUF881 domain-containing protein [Desulfitobacteriaceae bacterium]MDD4752123.1 DUF881 domain-containing protein [Desulfitobacteriaceae bacterium]
MIKKQWQIPLFIALFIFALLVSTQYRTQIAYVHSLSNQKSEDLVAIVKSLNEKRNLLEAELDKLAKTKRSLDEKYNAGSSLIANLTKDLQHLKVITGAVPVEGPGIIISITGDSNLMYLDLIDLVNELWVSGAEAIAINNIRIDNQTIISQGEDSNHRLVITVNNQPLLSPVVIKAIGNPDTLEKGLTFTGGIIDSLNTLYSVYPVIKKEENVTLPTAQPSKAFKHLQW